MPLNYVYCPHSRHATTVQMSSAVIFNLCSALCTLTRSTDVGRRHVLLGRSCFLPSTAVFLNAEGVTGLGRIGIPDPRAAATTLGLWGLAVAADDDLRPVAMSLANTMAAAAGVPDDALCSEAPPRFRATAVAPIVLSRTACTSPADEPFSSSPTTLGGPADRCPCSAPGGIVSIILSKGPRRKYVDRLCNTLADYANDSARV